jgi:extradiol dioxygenase family protein
MSIFKRTISLCLIITMLSQTLSIGITLVAFQANRQYYADVLCINKNRPELACQGKCVLMQKLQSQFDFEQNQTANKLQNLLEQDIVWALHKGLSLNIGDTFSLHYALNSSNFTYLEPLFTFFENGIFRPLIA